jgi:hypothetical protein
MWYYAAEINKEDIPDIELVLSSLKIPPTKVVATEYPEKYTMGIWESVPNVSIFKPGLLVCSEGEPVNLSRMYELLELLLLVKERHYGI